MKDAGNLWEAEDLGLRFFMCNRNEYAAADGIGCLV